ANRGDRRALGLESHHVTRDIQAQRSRRRVTGEGDAVSLLVFHIAGAVRRVGEPLAAAGARHPRQRLRVLHREGIEPGGVTLRGEDRQVAAGQRPVLGGGVMAAAQRGGWRGRSVWFWSPIESTVTGCALAFSHQATPPAARPSARTAATTFLMRLSAADTRARPRQGSRVRWPRRSRRARGVGTPRRDSVAPRRRRP